MTSTTDRPAAGHRAPSVREILRVAGSAARLAGPYFRSPERAGAFGLLAAIVVLSLIGVYFNVVYTYWYKVAYDALQAKNEGAFWASMFTYRTTPDFPWVIPGFCEIAVGAILAGVYAYYLNQMLQIHWRRWLTDHFIDDWLARQAYYRISLRARAGTPLDNPDQRIAEDLRLFTNSTLTIGLNFLSNIVTLLSFVGVLWIIAPPLHVGHVVIQGWLVWSALIYSIVGTGFTQIIGKRLIPLTYQQQQVEADFRFNLVRVRENTEQIALYRGESEEGLGLRDRFYAIYTNWWRIMKRTKSLNFFTIGFSQIALIFPFVVAAPNYFSGVFSLGVFMQILSIFGNVQQSLSWFVTIYPDLITWLATVQRLDGFESAMRDAHAEAAHPGLAAETGGPELKLEDLTVRLPSGDVLLEQEVLEIERGEPLALTGASGSGKSTFFRVVAGIWPFVAGRMQRPDGVLMFLPQRPYVPLGSLKRSVVYPSREDQVPDDAVAQALADVGLGSWASRLGEIDNWTLRLSGGEQQRLALARVLIVKPDWVFLDEALSAVEEARVPILLATLRQRLPRLQIVSITHQQSIAALHPRHAVVENGGGARRIAVVETDPAVGTSP